MKVASPPQFTASRFGSLLSACCSGIAHVNVFESAIRITPIYVHQGGDSPFPAVIPASGAERVGTRDSINTHGQVSARRATEQGFLCQQGMSAAFL